MFNFSFDNWESFCNAKFKLVHSPAQPDEDGIYTTQEIYDNYGQDVRDIVLMYHAFLTGEVVKADFGVNSTSYTYELVKEEGN